MIKAQTPLLYTDHPKPSTVFIVFLLICLILLAIPLLIISFMTNQTVRLYLLPLLLLLFLIFGLYLHAAFNTRYSVKSNKLFIRCGIFFMRIALQDIQRIHKKRVLWHVPGWNSKTRKGFNNRFANGLLIFTATKQIFISPNQPQEFTETLETLYGKPFPYTTFQPE